MTRRHNQLKMREWYTCLMSTDDWSCCHAIKSVSGANLHIIAFHRNFSESNSINCPLKQYIFPKILGVDWLYGAFSIDEHPSNPPSKLAVWCKSMQVNILRDFTEITMHVLQGQLTPKILSFPCLCERQILPSTPCNLVMEIYSSFRLIWSIVQVISVFWSSSH